MKAGLGIVLSTILFLFSSTSWSAPEKEYWAFWDKSNEVNLQQVDHSEWQLIIDKYLRYSEKYGMYLFVYGAVGKENQARLQHYLKSMSEIDPRGLRKKEQLERLSSITSLPSEDSTSRSYRNRLLLSIMEISSST